MNKYKVGDRVRTISNPLMSQLGRNPRLDSPTVVEEIIQTPYGFDYKIQGMTETVPEKFIDRLLTSEELKFESLFQAEKERTLRHIIYKNLYYGFNLDSEQKTNEEEQTIIVTDIINDCFIKFYVYELLNKLGKHRIKFEHEQIATLLIKLVDNETLSVDLISGKFGVKTNILKRIQELREEEDW